MGGIMFRDPLFLGFVFILSVVFIILFLGVTIVAVVSKITGKSKKAAAAGKIKAKENDRASLKKIIQRINRLGDINDPSTPRPLVTLEEFFNGNNDYSSIGYNFPPPQPSPWEFFELFLAIRNRPEVEDVLVQILDHPDPKGWPSSELVWVITSAGKAEIAGWLGDRFKADNLLMGFPGKMKLEKVHIPETMHAVGIWWD
jgi:hypothetical protein